MVLERLLAGERLQMGSALGGDRGTGGEQDGG
jgi:hypothetical protein